MPRLVSWNVNSRVGRLPEQVAALADLRCDIIALQEVKQNTAPQLRSRFQALGLAFVADSFECAPDKNLLVGHRRYGQLIASRWPLRTEPPELFDIPWRERVLSVVIETERGALELHTTHIPPGSSNGRVKPETLHGIYRRLATLSERPRILCGDFNAPKLEKPDGTNVNWRKRDVDWASAETLSKVWPILICQMRIAINTSIKCKSLVGLRTHKLGGALIMFLLPELCWKAPIVSTSTQFGSRA